MNEGAGQMRCGREVASPKHNSHRALFPTLRHAGCSEHAGQQPSKFSLAKTGLYERLGIAKS